MLAPCLQMGILNAPSSRQLSRPLVKKTFFGPVYGYNVGMDKKEYYNKCMRCGRPMAYAKPCECKYDDTCLSEYRCPMPACIKKKQPDCLAKAVIPAITVDTTAGLTNLANCFAHVTSINTTFYVDDKHRPMITWSGTVVVDVPGDISTEEEFLAFIKGHNLRDQLLYARFKDNELGNYVIQSFYFDKTGRVYGGERFEEKMEE